MEDKCPENKSDKPSDEAQTAGAIDDKATGKISTSTTTTSLYTEDEQDTQEAVTETIVRVEKPKNVTILKYIL